ncbi:MAG: cytochrome ubiquinol oxidase subunit I, partial [Muribaculaceae bacterium]|nr:cytochrome ubiquinol oxidase subunit I [Muribaculaceae bacterium]
AQEALRTYNDAARAGDTALMRQAAADVARDFRYFGYGYLESPEKAVPPVALTFYAFRVMVMLGGFLLLVLAGMALASTFRVRLLEHKWVLLAGMLSLPLVWICSQAGWIVAEVGRQPWTIQDLLPVGAAISDVTAAGVQTTFWIFAVLFTLLLVAEVSIMVRFIRRASHTDIETANKD